MHLQSILLFAAIIALVAAANQRSHILIAILSLEATSLILATLYSSNFSSVGEDYLGIILLTLAAAETASALGLLSTLSRFSGSDNLSSCSFSSPQSIARRWTDIIDDDNYGLLAPLFIPEWAQCGFQDPASDIIIGIVEFHDYVISNIIVVVIIVTSAYICLFNAKRTFRYFVENQHLETLWTILPAVILISLAIPSLRLLYLQDETWKPEFVLNAEGHQWYWEYELPNLLNSVDYPIPITSTYTLPITIDQSPNLGVTHLLEVTNRAILPTNSTIQILVSSADVLHAFTIPSLGVNVDAVPGRSNAWSVNINRPGVYTGQCSEICGVNHAFIPIVVEAVPYNTLLSWLNEII